jgi:Fe-S-cluster containining protein
VSDAPWFRDGLRMRCTQCGNCCSGPSGAVWLEQEDLEALAAFLSLDVSELLARYTEVDEGRLTLTEVRERRGYRCVFLARGPDGRGRCQVYGARPRQCRTWPFWPENLTTMESWWELAARCPGVARGLTGTGRRYSLEEIQAILAGEDGVEEG